MLDLSAVIPNLASHFLCVCKQTPCPFSSVSTCTNSPSLSFWQVNCNMFSYLENLKNLENKRLEEITVFFKYDKELDALTSEKIPDW